MKKLAVIFLFLCGSVFAEPLGLSELIDIALQNNPETERAWAHTKQAQAALGVARSANYPTLDVTGSFNHGREVKFPNGPNTIYTYGSGELALTYLLYDFGERSASIRATKEALKAARWTSNFTIQHIIAKVAANYYEYLNASELLKVAESSLSDADLIFSSAQELHKAGLKNVTDLNMSKAESAQRQMEAAQARARVAVAYGKLMTSLGLPVEKKLEVQTSPEGIELPLFAEGISQLIAAAEERRADLLAKKAKLSEAKQRVKRASKAPLPKIRALGQGGWLEYTKHEGSGYNYNTGIAVEIPIFRGFEYSYNKRLAIAEEQATAAELKELHDAIALEVLTYSESVKAASTSLKWSDEYMAESTKSYEGSLDCYKAGVQNIFDLIQAQRTLSNARMKHVEAKTQWLVSLAQLAFATGSLEKP